MINPSRRSLIIGIGASLIAAPAIVRASSLMKVKPLPSDGLWKCTYRELPTKLLDQPLWIMNPGGSFTIPAERVAAIGMGDPAHGLEILDRWVKENARGSFAS